MYLKVFTQVGFLVGLIQLDNCPRQHSITHLHRAHNCEKQDGEKHERRESKEEYGNDIDETCAQ